MKISIYELLELVKDEQAPKKIKYRNMVYHINYDEGDYESDIKLYRYSDYEEPYYLFGEIDIFKCLNDEVEILDNLEEEKVKPLTKKDIEALGYACGEIQKCFTNGWTKSLENKPLEEEKKIPEKLKIEQDTPTSNYYIRNENGTKCILTKHSKMIAETLNQLLDYLKSKGE